MKSNLFNFRHGPNEFQTPTTRARIGSTAVVDTTVRGRSTTSRPSGRGWGKAFFLFLIFLGLGFSSQAWAAI